MSINVFFISDTHFGHKSILEYMPLRKTLLGETLEEHNETLIGNWNSVVKPNDIVWHLGDVVFGLENVPLVGRLNGRKKLVLGNHDDERRLRPYFERIYGVSYSKGEGVATHVPVHPCQVGRGNRFKFNLHGHLHGDTVSIDRHLCTEYNELDFYTDVDWRYYNVCCDNIGYFPKPWEEIKKELKLRGVL